MRPFLIVPITLLLVAAAPAAAQTDQKAEPQATQPSSQTDKCRAQTGGKQQPADTNLSETLDNCGGVLTPPPTGDQGMTQPPPAEGKTPVIKPGEVPAQPPQQ
ncbi:hypothetical protein BPNPMPFG_002409 [Mesorhizobium sp. AR07]|uniref:hypothetical protein n=1 Tax=Mesorhizobium sp. AR07 TaxID=2865838 RepID=UPI0021610114|nr:hypothetical protein [Mesorhizobium sp. AR07]UVK46707.1 hypothetical protein BPNPMPFG_002409 [Mesorhizobium sp. AR07]